MTGVQTCALPIYSSQVRTLCVAVIEKTPTTIELLNVPTDFYVNHGANPSQIAADAKAAGIKVKVNYSATVSKTIDADDAQVAWSGTTTADGNVTATYTANDTGSTAKTATAAFKRYATVAAGAFTAKTGSEIDGFTMSSSLSLPGKVKVGDTVTITFKQGTPADVTFGNTRAVTATGGTIETLAADDWSVTNGDGSGTPTVEGVVSVTIEIKTITGATFSAEVEVDT